MSESSELKPIASAADVETRPGCLVLTQAGFENLAGRECLPGAPGEVVPGAWFSDRSIPMSAPWGGWCFPHVMARDWAVIERPSVNGLARALMDVFGTWLRGQRVAEAWPCLFKAAQIEGLPQHVAAVEAEFQKLLRDKLSRVAKLAVRTTRGCGQASGMLAFFPRKGTAWIARDFLLQGQQRMADDPAAPSRSYLKTEEAFVVLGEEPQAGETVVDLGAAPGGWSYSAAKRGASVVAIDNGPLKGGALGHPRIQHLRADAFFHRPSAQADWLFCDLVDDPHRVLPLISEWVTQRRCRRLVSNFKFGRVDPLALLDSVRDSLARADPSGAWVWRVRHLWHDREEFTLVGSSSPPGLPQARP